jgi:hypothetical protein
MIAETFFYCSDTYNQKFAHTTDNSLKWRPLYYDFDLSFGSTQGYWFNFFQQNQYIRGVTDDGLGLRITDTSLYNGFMRNDEWKLQFVKRYAEVLNTTLTTQNLLAIFDKMVASMKDEMPRNIAKWGHPSSMNSWNQEMSVLRDRIENRRKCIIDQLRGINGQLPDGLELSGAEFDALFPNG